MTGRRDAAAKIDKKLAWVLREHKQKEMLEGLLQYAGLTLPTAYAIAYSPMCYTIRIFGRCCI